MTIDAKSNKFFSRHNGERILVVDDDKGVSDFLIRFLESEGYQTDTARSGLEGIKKAKAGNFDLLLLDLRLPDMDGTEVLRRIRRPDVFIGVIIITGYPTVETAVKTFKDGVFDYIPKPFEIRDLRLKIKEALVLASYRKRSDVTRLAGIGSRIKRLRLEAGLSLTQLARSTKVTKGFISQLESGKRQPRLDTINAIAKVLHINAYLFFSDSKLVNKFPRLKSQIQFPKQKSSKLLLR